MGADSLLEDMYGNGFLSDTVNAATAGNQIVNITPKRPGHSRFGPVWRTRADDYECSTDRHRPADRPGRAEHANRGGNLSASSAYLQILLFFTAQYRRWAVRSRSTACRSAARDLDTTQLRANWMTLPRTTRHRRNGLLPAMEAAQERRRLRCCRTVPLLVYYNASANPLSNPPGGANSDYTAADFQHMLLAAQVHNAGPPANLQTLPSMHRPALIKYWITKRTAATWKDLWSKNPSLCRAILLRPIGRK